jgi:hypothetical protein
MPEDEQCVCGVAVVVAANVCGKQAPRITSELSDMAQDVQGIVGCH